MGDVGVAAILDKGSFGGELNEALVKMAFSENVIRRFAAPKYG